MQTRKPKMKVTQIQLVEGVTRYVGPQIVKVVGAYGAQAQPGTGVQKMVKEADGTWHVAQPGEKAVTCPNIAALTGRVDETQTQTCEMSVTRLGPCPAYVNAATACLGQVVRGKVICVVDSNCMAQS
jgi:hypothetical protein